MKLKEIQDAYQLIQPYIRKTLLRKSDFFSSKKTSVYLKFENEQITGSFKIRGAFNKILHLPRGDKRPLICSSAGNHAQAVAYAGKWMKRDVHIVMPTSAPVLKVRQTELLGGKVSLYGDIYDDAFKKALELNKKKKGIFIHPYDDDEIICGQATLGLEIFNEIKDLDSIVVPLGGGGLISGICSAVKLINPQCRIYGVVSKYYSSMKNLFYQTKGQHNKIQRTLADGIAVKKPNERIYKKYIEKYVDDIRDVSEELILEAINQLIEQEKSVVEGAGAVGIASLSCAKKWSWNLGKKTCLILSGGNIDLSSLSKVIEKGLLSSQRIQWLKVVVDDHPGSLSKICEIIGKNKGNILEVKHDRYHYQLSFQQTQIEILIETQGHKHFELIRNEFKKLSFIRLV